MISEWFPEQEISLRRAAPVASDTYDVRTYYVSVNITLSVNEEIVQKARRRAEAMGKSVNQLVREYLERLAGAVRPERRCRRIRATVAEVERQLAGPEVQPRGIA